MKKIAVLLALCLFFPTAAVHAQAASVSVEKNEVVLDFPNTLLFSAEFSSNDAIEKVMLHYGTSQDTCGNVSAVGFPEFTSGKKVAVEWEWDMRQSGGEPPGTAIWWQWETVDGSGISQLTDRQQITWIDDVHPWEVIDRGQVRLHHYYSDASIGNALADAAVSALAHLKQDIGMLPEEPIDLYMYDSTEALVESVFYVPGWTGGLAYSDYNILLIGMAPNDLEWGKKHRCA